MTSSHASDRALLAERPLERRRAAVNLACALLACAWLLAVALTLDPTVDDFRQYWQAAANVRAVGDPYATTPGVAAPDAPVLVTYPNPPLLAYLMLPLSALPHPAARLVWLSVNTALLGALVWLSLIVSRAQAARRWWGVVAFVVAVSPPARLSLQLGQVSMLLAVLPLAALALAARAPRGRMSWQAAVAGLLLALATLLKLYPGLIGLYYLLRGPRAVAWAAAAAGALILAASLAIHGPGPYQTYVQHILLGGFYPYEAEFNVSLVGLWERLLTPSPYSAPLADLPWLARLLALLSSAAVLGACLWALHPSARVSEDHGAAAWLCAMLLLAPVNGAYNLVLVLPCALLIWDRAERAGQRAPLLWLAIALGLCAVPPGWTAFNRPLYAALHTGWGIVALQPALFGLLAILALLLWQGHRPAAGSAGADV